MFIYYAFDNCTFAFIPYIRSSRAECTELQNECSVSIKYLQELIPLSSLAAIPPLKSLVHLQTIFEDDVFLLTTPPYAVVQ